MFAARSARPFERPASPLRISEGDVVVAGGVEGRIGRSQVVGVAIAGRCAALAAATASAAEQHDAIGPDLGGAGRTPFLVRPLTRLDAPLDVDLLALRQVLVQRLGGLPPDDDAVPLGFFALLAIAIGVTLGGGQTDRGDRRAAGRAAQFGSAAEVADQKRGVDAQECPDSWLLRRLDAHAFEPLPRHYGPGRVGILRDQLFVGALGVGALADVVVAPAQHVEALVAIVG